LEEARKLCQPDLVVAVMSGHFTQRGEAAIVDKWARAEMALRCGVDVVFELPVAWALRSARDFAHGAVHHLHLAGATHLCFGSESADLDSLSQIADLLTEEPPEFREELRRQLQEGRSFPRARANAVNRVLRNRNNESPPGAPNDILGVEYLTALRRLDSTITPLVLKRQGAGYHDTSLHTSMASATAIRQGLLTGSSVPSLPLPDPSQYLLARELALGRGPVTLSSFFPIILHKLRAMSHDDLDCLPDMERGLSYRLKRVAGTETDLPSLLTALKTKRYTWTRLQRLLCYVLLQIRAEDLASIHKKGPSYLRMLALRKGKSALLSNMPLALPLITSPAKAEADHSLTLDQLATDLYVLGFPNPQEQRGSQDLTRPPVFLE
jgi:predicted nucleotidyltransferase